MKKKDFLPYTLLFIQPIFMASNLVVARGGVEFVPPISLAFLEMVISIPFIDAVQLWNLIQKKNFIKRI